MGVFGIANNLWSLALGNRPRSKRLDQAIRKRDEARAEECLEEAWQRWLDISVVTFSPLIDQVKQFVLGFFGSNGKTKQPLMLTYLEYLE